MDGTGRYTITNRVELLVSRESELVRKLEQCIPPIDQHRRDLERVRSELQELRRANG
jgi:hypothetical protein